MKKFYSVLLFLCIYIVTTAQTLSSTATAIECIRFIENAAKTYIGKETGTVQTSEVSFTGNTFMSTRKGNSLSFKREWKNLVWPEFKRFASVPTEGDKIFVIFYFNGKNIQVEKSTINGGAVTDFKSEPSENFSFYIPSSEKDRIAGLETAAKRLAQLSTENGTLFPSNSGAASKIKI